VLLTIKILLRGDTARKVDLAGSFFPEVILLSSVTQVITTIFSTPWGWFSLENCSRKAYMALPHFSDWKQKHQHYLPHISNSSFPPWRSVFKTPKARRCPQIQLKSLRSIWAWKIGIANHWSIPRFSAIGLAFLLGHCLILLRYNCLHS